MCVGGGRRVGKLERWTDDLRDEIILGLERIPKRQLKKGMECPICGFDFIDGK